MSADAPDHWFYSEQGAQRGPVPLATLREMLTRGQLMWTEMVWTVGMPSWSPASNVRELKQPVAPGDRPPPLPPQTINYAGPMPPPYAEAGTNNLGADPTLRMLLPVGRSGWAIAAGYLGLLSPLMIFAPFSLIVSIIAIRDIKRRDTRGMGRALLGLIMGAIFTVILLIGIGSFFVS